MKLRSVQIEEWYYIDSEGKEIRLRDMHDAHLLNLMLVLVRTNEDEDDIRVLKHEILRRMKNEQ